jgi:hypothetical protein
MIRDRKGPFRIGGEPALRFWRIAPSLQRRLGRRARYTRDLIKQGNVGRIRSARMSVNVNASDQTGPDITTGLLTPPNFSHVLSIYAGHFMDMLFQSVGFPKKRHDTIEAMIFNSERRTHRQYPIVLIGRMLVGERPLIRHANDEFQPIPDRNSTKDNPWSGIERMLSAVGSIRVVDIVKFEIWPE